MKQRAKYAHTVTSASLGAVTDAELYLQATRGHLSCNAA
jgi:hypothetical protein